jgi:asparagine synthase (glutamine-hydrolysing)
MYDEPFGDSSAIPTFLVSQLARRHVKVALSGDGGDELFAGYARYQRTSDIWTSLRRVPYAVRKTMSFGVAALARRRNNASARATTARLAQYLGARNAGGVYQVQMAQRHDAQEFVVSDGGSLGETPQDPAFLQEEIYATMMYADALNYLPDDILVKVDRASMAVGLEVRVPMLDHRVLEFAWQVPLHMKVRDREGKWLLQQVLKKYAPDALPVRPKMGFGVPVGDWVRGALRDWAESLLGEDRLRRDGLLDPKLAREQWMLHLAGDSGGNDRVWHMLAFQAWLSSVA